MTYKKISYVPSNIVSVQSCPIIDLRSCLTVGGLHWTPEPLGTRAHNVTINQSINQSRFFEVA